MALPYIGPARLVLAAAASIALWQAAEYAVRRSGSDAAILLAAATTMQHASQVIRKEKTQRNLMQGERLDPNRTGLVGPEWSETTTTLGDLPAKRTLTNPDTAALVARLLHESRLKAGDTVAVVLSGSFVGANVAVMSAIEAYGLKSAVLTSLGASMYGAADPAFTWLDMESAVRAARIWRSGSLAALLGGESAMARGLGEQPRRDLEASARRAGVPLIAGSTLADAVKGSAAALGLDAPPAAAAAPKLLINVGGAQAALGDCRQSADIPAGLIAQPLPCSGTPGLVHTALARGIPVLNIHKVKALAQRYGLPFDPVPLPMPGRNAFIYGN